MNKYLINVLIVNIIVLLLVYFILVGLSWFFVILFRLDFNIWILGFIFMMIKILFFTD